MIQVTGYKVVIGDRWYTKYSIDGTTDDSWKAETFLSEVYAHTIAKKFHGRVEPVLTEVGNGSFRKCPV